MAPSARYSSGWDAAYGCSLGGACLTRFLALGEIPVGRAVIDAGITPYRLPLLLRWLINLGDFLGVRLVMWNRKLLEAVYPPERWTLPGRDPKTEYDVLAAYLRTYSDRTIRNVFWSANNYALPPEPAKTGCTVTYWYGQEEARPGAGISALSGTISRMSRPSASPRRTMPSWSCSTRRNSMSR